MESMGALLRAKCGRHAPKHLPSEGEEKEGGAGVEVRKGGWGPGPSGVLRKVNFHWGLLIQLPGRVYGLCLTREDPWQAWELTSCSRFFNVCWMDGWVDE